MRVQQWNVIIGGAVVALSALASAACGDVARTGRSSGYVVLDKLEGASGADPEKFGGNLASDVITNVKVQVNGQEVLQPTFYNDIGRAAFRLGLKDPGPAASPTTPSPLNSITLTRYRVTYVRADGRNTQGVDVPYAFDGGMTITVPASGSAEGTFNLVRNSAKLESPLLNMGGFGGAQMINTLAEVTFYGRDQAGNEVSVSGTISVTFADFGDPQ